MDQELFHSAFWSFIALALIIGVWSGIHIQKSRTK